MGIQSSISFLKLRYKRELNMIEIQANASLSCHILNHTPIGVYNLGRFNIYSC